jgi:hypothetical protein
MVEFFGLPSEVTIFDRDIGFVRTIIECRAPVAGIDFGPPGAPSIEESNTAIVTTVGACQYYLDRLVSAGYVEVIGAARVGSHLVLVRVTPLGLAFAAQHCAAFDGPAAT